MGRRAGSEGFTPDYEGLLRDALTRYLSSDRGMRVGELLYELIRKSAQRHGVSVHFVLDTGAVELYNELNRVEMEEDSE
jgi:hypothetical protein